MLKVRRFRKRARQQVCDAGESVVVQVSDCLWSEREWNESFWWFSVKVMDGLFTNVDEKVKGLRGKKTLGLFWFFFFFLMFFFFLRAKSNFGSSNDANANYCIFLFKRIIYIQVIISERQGSVLDFYLLWIDLFTKAKCYICCLIESKKEQNCKNVP